MSNRKQPPILRRLFLAASALGMTCLTSWPAENPSNAAPEGPGPAGPRAASRRAPPPSPQVWPAADWPRAAPSEVGLEESKLLQARDYALTCQGSGYITRHGKLVLAWGDPRQRYDLKSTTKSFGSIALGLALKDGKLRLEDKAVEHHPTLGLPPESNAQTGWLDDITILDLASQTAGFEKPGGYTKLLFKPGTKWDYSDSGPNWLAECITLAYDRDLDELMFARVFEPLGIGREDLTWRKNAYRPATIEGIPRREFGAGIHANVEAMARIGYLMLREGQWRGREILTRQYARESPRTPPAHARLPVLHPETYSQAASHYGLLWWNNDDGALPGVPRDAFWSWGLYDSLIVVIPSLDLVAARAGKSWKRTPGARHYQVLEPFFTPIVDSVQDSPPTEPHQAAAAGVPSILPGADASDDYFPPPESAGGWRKLEKPAEIRRLAGLDPAKLAELEQWLRESDNRNFAAVVIRHGYIALEVERGNSAKTDSRRVASVSKAICATVLAIASERSQHGLTPRRMTFDDRAFDFIPWAQPLSDPRKAQITIKQLLNHTSGICPEATGAPNDGAWEYILGHTGDPRTAQLAFDPGTACGYSTHALAHAALVCETVTGRPYDQFAIEALFQPLGIEHWWFQYYEGGQKYGRHPSHGLGMPARDLARIAYCMLKNGRWGSRQIVPKWFVEQTAEPTHSVQGQEMRFKINAQTFSHGWELPARLTGEGGRSGQGIPADARFKPGSGGQLIAFVPSLDLVITRQTGSSGSWQYEEYLRRACQAVSH